MGPEKEISDDRQWNANSMYKSASEYKKSNIGKEFTDKNE